MARTRRAYLLSLGRTETMGREGGTLGEVGRDNEDGGLRWRAGGVGTGLPPHPPFSAGREGTTRGVLEGPSREEGPARPLFSRTPRPGIAWRGSEAGD